MTTNEPEVVAYLHTDKESPEYRGVSLHHDESCTNTLSNTEPLVRLSDYQKLQAKCRILESELATVKKVEYVNVEMLEKTEVLHWRGQILSMNELVSEFFP